ncbi:MAG: SPOR domain-containing protein [Flavobacteriales bacterium]|nr:SPOR domain-containing protein [Flavobacteriales bacterium]
MIYTSNDLLDGRTADSQGDRQGNSQNDRLLMANVGINYDLNITPKQPEIDSPFVDENGNLIVFNDSEDADGDGVNDFLDECQGTPAGAVVDKKGCPVDSDGDGYADCFDEEPNSPHTYVDGEGVAMDDDFIYERYLMYNDSIPWDQTAWNQDFAKKESDMNHWSNTYSVQVGAESEGLSQAQINAILSLKDITSVEENGERIFLAGEFQELPDAVERQLELEREGFEGEVITQTEGMPIAMVGEEAQIIANELRAKYQAPENSEGIIFRIQLGAFRNDLNHDIFADVDDVIALKGQDGLTRYMAGSFRSMEEAVEAKTDLLIDGFTGAFITSYADGERITLAQAGASVIDESKDLTYDYENSSIDPEKVAFRVQLGVFKEDIPTSTLDAYLKLGEISNEELETGERKYLTACCRTLEEAEEVLAEAIALGIVDAFIIGEFNDMTLTVAEAQNLILQQENSAEK